MAMSDPSNVLALDDLKLMTGTRCGRWWPRPRTSTGLIGRMSRLDDAVAEAVEEDEEELAEVTEIRESADDAPVIKLVNSIIAQARRGRRLGHPLRARGPRDARALPRGRRAARDAPTIPRRMVAGVISRVKIMADLDIAEKRVPQDGRVSLTVDGHAIDTARRHAAARATARAS